MLEQAWLIPALPYAAFVIILFAGKRLPGKGHEIGILAVGGSLLVSLVVFLQTISRGGGEELGSEVHAFEKSLSWARFGDGPALLELGMNIDGLSAVMFVVVCTVALLVMVYSVEYMRGDVRYTFYYAILALFTGSMLNLVIANNLIQMLIGWEGVGLCSYFLIGHWHEEKENSNAAIKAFITTRLGDVGFTFGIFALFFAAGTFNIADISHAVEAGEISKGILTVTAVLLFFGAIGKSAQVPLHVWLPDAMAGPTPVSALIHAATMVVAGVYLVARMYTVFHGAPAALNEVAIIGGITMVLAAILALVQDDIKRVLAYSTISQLAYMVAALGVGAYTAGVFHIWTHAWFKALLFLGAGSVSHAVHSFSMSKMGGLKNQMPTTFKTYLIGSLALAGLFPLAGFWSKDEILVGAWEAAQHSRVAAFVFIAALATAGLTAAYVARMLALTFFGKPKYDTAHVKPHESPGLITGPLVILAVLAVAGGWIGLPGEWNLFGKWIHFEGTEHGTFKVWLALLSTAVAVGGLAAGWFIFRMERVKIDLLATPAAPLYRLLQRRLLFDELYMAAIVRPLRDTVSRAAYWTNQKVLDGAVNLAGSATVLLGRGAYHGLDQPVIDGLVNGLAGGTGAAGRSLKFWQSGNIQAYAASLFFGIVFFVGAFLLVQR